MSLNNNLNARWHFSGNTNDSSGAGNNLTNNGAVLTTDKNSNPNQAYLLNGISDHLSITDVAQTGLDLIDSFSCSASINVTNKTDVPIISKYGAAGQKSFFLKYVDGLGFQLETSSDGTNTVNSSIPYTLNTSQWYDIVVTYESGAGSFSVYVDKNLVGTATGLSTSLFDSNADFQVGAVTSIGSYLTGKIDEVRIFSRILGPHEAIEIGVGYDSTNDNFETLNDSLDVLLHFTGNANDSSGNGNNGTVTGAVLTTDKNAVPNQAYLFDGASDYITLSGISTSTLNKAISFSVNISAVTSQDYFFESFTGVGNERIGAGVDSATGTYIIYDGNGTWVNTGVAYTLGVWKQLSYVFNDDTVYFYEDEHLVYSGSVVAVPFMAAPKIGSSYDNLSSFFNGKIDEFRIYTRASAHQEVKMLSGQYDSGAGSSNTLNQNILNKYTFTGNTNDDSGNGNDLTNNGAVLTTDFNAVPNQAYLFNGSGNYMTGTPIGFAGKGEAAFSVNIDPSGLSSGYFLLRNGTSQLNLAVERTPDDIIRITWYKNGNLGGAQLVGTIPITTEKTHIASSYSVKEGVAKLWVDGVLDVTAPCSDVLNSTDGNLFIGRNGNAGSSFYFAGKMDEWIFYENSLTTNEVQALFNGYDSPTTEVSSDLNIPAGFGSVDLTGFSGTTFIELNVSAGFGVVDTIGYAAESLEDSNVLAGFGVVDLTAHSATSSATLTVPTGFGVVDTIGYAAQSTSELNISAGFGSVDLTGYSANSLEDGNVLAGFGIVDVSGFSAISSVPLDVPAGFGITTLTGNSALVGQPLDIPTGFGSVNLTGFAAQSIESDLERIGFGTMEVSSQRSVINGTIKNKIQLDSKLFIN